MVVYTCLYSHFIEQYFRLLLADHMKGIPWLLCHAGFIKATAVIA